MYPLLILCTQSLPRIWQASHQLLWCTYTERCETKTWTETETETDTENKYTEPNGNLCCYLSQCSVNNSTQSYTSHFLCLGTGLGLGLVSVNAPLPTFQCVLPSSYPEFSVQTASVHPGLWLSILIRTFVRFPHPWNKCPNWLQETIVKPRLHLRGILPILNEELWVWTSHRATWCVSWP